MTDTRKNFSDFSVGDCAVFTQRFDAADFDAFAALSGDTNPLHHDTDFAAASDFGRPIVPMHMTMAPLSRIAGMIFPGDPSLYLGHTLSSILPVFYGDTLTYSARVTAVNAALRMLTIRVLVIRGAEVVLDADMRVRSQAENWTPVAAQPNLTPTAPAALITGATGDIGTALAADLARRGWHLLLADRGPGARRDALAATLAPLAVAPGQRIDHVTADLTQGTDTDALCALLADRSDVGAIFHTASPPLDAPIADLVQVNYTALRRIALAAVPGMLMRQQGVVATIGSVATERVIPGWDDYAAAKAMAGQFLTAFDKTHAGFGLRGLTVLSGLVATRYSADVQGNAPAMLPEELASAVIDAALTDRAGHAMIIEWSGRRDGKLGFHTPQQATAAISAPQAGTTAQAAAASPDSDDAADRIAAVVRRKLKLASDAPLAGGGVGVTPGWDSLGHIQLILELESAFGIHFAATEIDRMLSYEGLVDTTRARLAAA